MSARARRSSTAQYAALDLRQQLKERRIEELRQLRIRPGDFTVIDVETANADRASVCQVGVAVVKSWQIVATWSQLVNPHTPGWTNTRTHGITSDMVRNMPSFRDIYPRIMESLAGPRVISHSWYDEIAIRKACELHRMPMLPGGWIDSIQIAKLAWPLRKIAGKGYRLRYLANDLGIHYRAHDAGEDAKVAAKVVLRAAAVIGKGFLRRPDLTVRGR